MVNSLERRKLLLNKVIKPFMELGVSPSVLLQNPDRKS